MSGLVGHRGLLMQADNLGAPLIEHLFNNSLANTGSGGTLFTGGSASYDAASKVEGSHSYSGTYLQWSAGNTSFLSPPEFIFEFYIKVNAYPGAGAYHAVSTRRSGFSSQVYSLLFNGDTNNLTLELRTTTGTGTPNYTMEVSRSLFPLSVWTHFRLSRSGGVFRIFVNGAAQASLTAGPISTGSSSSPQICGSSALTSLSASYDLLRYYDTVGAASDFTPPTS